MPESLDRLLVAHNQDFFILSEAAAGVRPIQSFGISISYIAYSGVSEI